MVSSEAVLCDSSSLISLTSSCLDNVLYFLNHEYGIQFLIPRSVEEECITYPLTKCLKEHVFSARKIQKAIRDGVLTRVEKEVTLTEKILQYANNLFFMRGKALPLVHRGEAEMLALANEIGVSTLLLDERTTRMLIEAPFRIKEHLEVEFNVNIMVDKNSLAGFADLTKNVNIIRASELIVIAYEKGFLDQFGEEKSAVLQAALYKIKYAGCSIRFDEIDEFINSLRGR